MEQFLCEKGGGGESPAQAGQKGLAAIKEIVLFPFVTSSFLLAVTMLQSSSIVCNVLPFDYV